MGTSKIEGGEADIDSLIRACRHGHSKELDELLGQAQGGTEVLLNQQARGTTPLHDACCYGMLDCVKVLLKHKADCLMWDVRGFSAIHSAAYNNHCNIVRHILSRVDGQCSVSCRSKYDETPLLVACMRGHYKLARLLVDQENASVSETDEFGNTVLIQAAGSDNTELLEWLLTNQEVRDGIDSQNKFGHSAAHRACLLGCKNSVGVLVHNGADFSLEDCSGHTPLTIAQALGNISCHKTASREEDSLPPLPSSYSSKDVMVGASSESVLSSLAPPPLLAQRSVSSGHDSSDLSLSNSTGGIPRRASLTGMSRPVNLDFRSRSSQKRRSLESSSGYITLETANRISHNLEHQDSKGWEETHQVVYDNTAFDPPPNIIFTPPVKKVSLCNNSRMLYCSEHDLKVRISTAFWENRKPEEKLEVCVAAAMHFNRLLPKGYTIVSPVCFVSCKTSKPCEVRLTLPHATLCQFDEDHKKVAILATSAYDLKWSPDSPLFSPGEHPLVPLVGVDLQTDRQCVKFTTTLVCPSLYAVAVKDNFPCPLPLRCSLFVTYPELSGESSTITAFDIMTYVGMTLKTVTTAVTTKLKEERRRFEEVHFTLTSDSIKLSGQLNNSSQDWDIERRGSGELKYAQLALTQDTDSDSYSLLFAYPPHESFFIEPKNAVGAVRCRISVADFQGRELVSTLVVPFSPKKEATPQPTPPPSQPTSQVHLFLPTNPVLISEV